MRSVHIQKDKTIFKLNELPAEAYAASMGLPGAPQIKLLDGGAGSGRKNRSRGSQKKEEEKDDGPTVIHQKLASDSEDSGSEGSDESESEDERKAASRKSESGSESGSGSESESGSDSGSESDSSQTRPARTAPVSYPCVDL